MNEIRCEHAGLLRRNENFIPLKDDTVLILCDECAIMVKSSVLNDMVKEALIQVFKATVGDALK